MGRRVLQVVDTLAVGGRERLVVDLANELAIRGFESRVCQTRHPGRLTSDLAPEVTAFSLDRSRRLDVRAMTRFARYIRENRIEIVHSHGRAVTEFVVVMKRSFRVDVPVVFHDHLPGVDGSTPASVGLRLTKAAGIDAVVGVSDDLAEWARGCLGFRSDRVWSIPNGIPVTRFLTARPLELRAAFGLPAHRPVAVALANVRPQKDYETLLRAVAQCRSQPSLVVVGSLEAGRGSYGERCLKLCHDLGLGERVAFAGTRLDVAEILAGADLGVLASRRESGPLAVAEYSAAGLPIVATATGSITEAVRGHRFARVVPVGDACAVAYAIDELLSQPLHKRRLLRAEARLAARSFSHTAMVSAIEEVYATIAKDSPWTPTI